MLNEKFWAKYFRVYDILNTAIPYQELLRDICDELDIKKGDEILEAGSGTGNLAMAIKERGGSPVALDNVEEALERHKQKDDNANTVFGDLTKKLPFPNNHFDKICSNNVLYAISRERREGVLKEFYRVLKPEGKIVISNLHRGFKPGTIYTNHLKKDFKQNGFFVVIKKILIMILPTLKMFYYNAKIKKENNFGDYDFMELKEQGKMLQKAGFVNASREKLVYADQGVLISAEKKHDSI